MLSFKWKAALAASAVLAASGAAAATFHNVATLIVTPPGFVGPALPTVNPREYVESYVARALAPLRAADKEGDGLDRKDAERERLKAESQRRASAIARVLTFDLNGDQKVTRDEGVKAAAVESLNPPSDIWKYDANRDQTITLKEITETVAAEVAAEDRLAALLALDPNKDDVLIAAELEQVARAEFARVDADGSGDISGEEYQAARKDAQLTALAVRCRMPPPAPGVQVVAVGAYEGNATADVTLGGQEETTSAASILVEPGAAQIYLVLASYDPMVWKLEGETKRLSQVVVSSAQGTTADLSASGVTGVNRRKVTVLPRDCIRYFYPDQRPNSESRGKDPVQLSVKQITAYLGRAPDVVAGAHGISRVSVPSGIVARRTSSGSAPVPPGFDPATWHDAARFASDGLMRFDPKEVVGSVSAERYEVLPQGLGLAQLVGSGGLQRVGRGVYRIVKPIPRFPPGLAGGHSVEFILPAGMPMPQGSPAHSCIRFEDDREPVGPICGMQR